MNDGFTEIGTGETWNGKDSNLAVGASITGEYISHQTDVGPNKAQMYTLRTADGDKGIWGSTVLDGRFEQVRIGDIVRVTFQGESAKPGKFGKPFKLWKVESKPGVGTALQGPVVADPSQAELEKLPQINLDDLPY
jgi:hypothetical protein